jgi:hypothetical protein
MASSQDAMCPAQIRGDMPCKPTRPFGGYKTQSECFSLFAEPDRAAKGRAVRANSAGGRESTPSFCSVL